MASEQISLPEVSTSRLSTLSSTSTSPRMQRLTCIVLEDQVCPRRQKMYTQIYYDGYKVTICCPLREVRTLGLSH